MEKTLIEPTEYIKKLFPKTCKESESDAVLRILKQLQKLNLEYKHEFINKLYNQRTAEQILKDGFVTGCTDDAIVFIAAAKANGLKLVYVETLEKSWLEKPMDEKAVRGHVFVKINNLLIDPQRKVVHTDPDWLWSRYAVYAEGNEPYDLGLTDFETSMKKFMDFKEKYQKEKVRS